MHLVVPGEKRCAVGSCISESSELRLEAGLIFQGLEPRLRIRVIVRDVRPAVRLGDIQIGQQRLHWLGAHAAATVGMQRELTGLAVLFHRAVGYKLLASSALSRSATIQPTT